jgi:glycosyltransferase involved in cell wall biosynthesis
MAEALVRAGHRVDVIYDVDAYRLSDTGSRRHPQPPAIQYPLDRGAFDRAAPAHSNGVRVHALRSSLGLLSPLLTHQLGRPVVHRRAIERLLRSDVDVVHFHNVSLVGGPGILGYGDALKLYTAHEHWLVCPTHVLWRHDREPCAGRECLRCLAHYRRPPQLWRWSGLLERSARQVDAFCSPSRFSIDKHREFGFEQPMTLMPPFLPEENPSGDLWVDHRDAPITDDRPPMFLFVGRLERIKGLDDVIPLFAAADGRAELWIAGDGTHEHELRRLAANAPRVRFLGRVEPERVCGLLREARALVVPSAGFEVFPLVLLEAFREGTPVIARRLGPFPEVVDATGGGLTFSTPGELRAALDRLASDRDLGRRLGANARAAFESQWSERAFLERYFELIANLARRKGRKSLLARCPRAVLGAGMEEVRA